MELYTFSMYIFFFLFFFKFLFYFWLCLVFVAACGLFSGCGEQGLLFIAVHGLLIAMAFVAERRL